VSIPFQPIVYEHAAALIGERPWTVSRSAELLFRAHREAHRRYGHSQIVAGIDVYNVEAEAYGAQVADAGGYAIPSISRHPCSGVEEILALQQPDVKRHGRFPDVLEAAVRLRDACVPVSVAVPLNGPFSIASNLLGFEDLLIAILTEPDVVAVALQHLAAFQVVVAEEILGQGLDIVFFESAATPPLLSPAQFTAIELPALTRLMDGYAAAAGRPGALVIGGNTLGILDAIARTGAGSIICPSETDQRAFMEKMRAYPEMFVRVNMSPGVFSAQEAGSALAEAGRTLAIARGRERVCIGTGVLPYDADPAIILQVQTYIQEKS
jgi:uroporphyrinogen-III decarboxylase